MTEKAESTRNKPGLFTVDSPKESESGLTSSFVAFLLFDEKLNCVSAKATEKVAGLSEEVVLGKNMADIVLDIKETGRYDRYLNVIETGEPFIADDIIAHTMFGDMHLNVKAFKVGNGLGVVVSDVTELKSVEEALCESEVSYRDLVESTSDIVFTISANGAFLALNPAFETITGWSRAEWIGKPSASLVHPDDLSFAKNMFRHLLEGEKPPTYELRILSKSGECSVVEVAMIPQIREGRVVCVLGIARDITERKRGEEELRVKDSAIVSSINAILMADLEGNITYVNPSFLNMWGYVSVEEVLGKNVLEAWQFSEEALGVVEALFKTESWRGELVAMRKDGTTFDVQLSASVVKDENGNPMCWMVSLIDISEHKQAEETLRRSEEYYRALIENSLEGIVILNSDGTFRYESPSMEHVLGRKPGDRIGKNSFEFVHPDDIDKAGEVFAQLMQEPGSMLHTEIRALHKDGSWRTLEVVGRNLVDVPEVAGIVANFRDVTERKQAEEALRESEEKYRTILEDIEDGYYEVDIAGNFTFFNDPMCGIIGYSKDEMMGMNNRQYMDKENAKKVYQAFNRTYTTGKHTEESGWEFIRKDGTKRFIEASVSLKRNSEGEPIGFRGIVRDITERKQAEEALRESEEQYSVLVGNLADAVFRFSDGVLTWGNDRIKEMLGYDKDEVINIDVSLFLPDEGSLTQLYKEVNSGLKKQGYFHGTTRAKKKDGSILDIEYTASPIPGKDPMELVGVARDITELKRMEQQLQLSGRLASVGQLAAGVAHELNNPLAAVQAYAQFLASRKDLDETLKRDIETIYKEAQRAGRITANLLSFARKHEPQKSFISINELIEESLELHAYRMRVNNIEVFTELDPDLPFTMADFHQMQQVFVNIITNAEQAMTEANDKGKLSIKTQKVGEMIQITCADDGPGVPEDDLKRIFDPFFTTKDVGQGTGLGLSICYGIVQEHGGNLYARSKPGEGTTVVVEIPIISKDKVGAGQSDVIEVQEA